ncbi:MAG: DUF1328 domain-containing protein [Mesorhizobium amorphae]|nr:MAG: DUF1328 domain-containing protein [Mesorhizobium amorphae]
MVKWILILAVIAVVAGWLGFGGVSRIAGGGAKILLTVLIVGIVLLALLFWLVAGSVV